MPSKVKDVCRLSSVRAAFRVVGATLILSGCAQLGQHTGFEAVKNTTQERIGKEVLWAKSDADRELISQKTSQLLSQPLSVDDAVQLALLNNKKLQASFYELGISEANVVAASRLPNPRERHERYGRHGNASARKYLADDDRRRPIRLR
jgi:hypothetical protein